MDTPRNKKDYKKLIFHEKKTEQDIHGNITRSSQKQVFIQEKEPEYVKLYLEDIMRLEGLPNSSNSLLFELLKKANYDNEIVIVKGIKDEICSKIGIADITFRKALQSFVEKGILSKKSRGVYGANPFLFGRGSWDNIKNIRLMIEYNEHGRFIFKEENEKNIITNHNKLNPKELKPNPLFLEQSGETEEGENS